MKTLLPLLLAPTLLLAQATPTVKQAPPPGIEVPEADATELKTGLDALGKDLESLRASLKSNPADLALLPDVEVFHKAVRYAVQYNEFFNPKEIPAAKAQLAVGAQRAKELREGKPSWTSATGPLVLGYTSKIDGSAQPYGLIVPDDWKPGDTTPRPLYLWFHGRGDTISEVNFIASRLKGKHDFSTPNAFELHLYGRYCNASKFAGETDCFEAMADVQRRYSIDPDRIVEMGFSMGGATGWHMAAHHPGLWAAGSSGAGFAETAIYAKVDEPGKEPPAPWERKLFCLYDCPPIAANYGNLPFIAYSGELDAQKQSGDLMNKAFADAGLKMEWLIGPGVGHKYEPETKKELSKRINDYVAKGREPLPPHIHFQTFTLRYNECKWIKLDALEQHWERADIDATLVDRGTIHATTKNITAFTIQYPPTLPPPEVSQGAQIKTPPPPPLAVAIDGQDLKVPWPHHTHKTIITDSGDERPSEGKKGEKLQNPFLTDRENPATPVTPPANQGWIHFRKVDGKWQVPTPDIFDSVVVESGPMQLTSVPPLSKRHGLQGPIDDAFIDSFIFVRPTGEALNKKVGAWAQSELDRAIVEWRKVFRGDARVKDDTAITGDDAQHANLVFWGDPGSNKALAKLLPRLPIQWTKDKLTMGAQSANAADHAPIFIYPNPASPGHYIVVNSGFTFRQGATTSNSLQTPKLPDWALIDLNTPPDIKWPGKIEAAGFFDERWQWKKE